MKVPRLIYLIGVPGSGKTTLLDAAFERLDWERKLVEKPFAHELLVKESRLKGVYLGKQRESFSGTDALSMSAQPVVLQWLESERPFLVLGEGDRLGNARFFDAVMEIGYELRIIVLDTPEEVAAQRRAQRGSAQDPTWLKGRVTKTERLKPRAYDVLDGRMSVPDLTNQLAPLLAYAG